MRPENFSKSGPGVGFSFCMRPSRLKDGSKTSPQSPCMILGVGMLNNFAKIILTMMSQVSYKNW